MRTKWVGLAVTVSLIMGLLAPAGLSQAADKSVKVTLPDFAVNLNGNMVENQYREYPLLVYRDITYVPMTWYDSRLLGLEAAWSGGDGLTIKLSQVTSSYMPYKSQHRNSSAYMAEVPSLAVTVNGNKLDNSKEDYPLLSFRDVTYFPLTWRFAHNEFGWDYQWDSTNGLSITSHNPQVQTVALPASAGDNDIALFKGYYYFVETTDMTNRVYRAPMQQPAEKEEIYSYTFYEADRMPKVVSFQIRGHALWFVYHLGGGVTGADNFVKIVDKGKAELIHRGYLDFRDTPYGTLFINLGADNDSGNLYLVPPSQDRTNRKTVGDPNLKFAQHAARSKGFAPLGANTATTVVGDDAYVLCSPNLSEPNFIYKINLKTDKTEKLINSGVSWFRIIDNRLYYVKDQDNALYTSAQDGTNELKLSDHAVTWFDSIGSNLFYTTKKEENRYELYQVDPNGKNTLVWKSPVASVQAANDRLVLMLNDNDDYGVVLLDSSGRLLQSVTDRASRILTSDAEILFQNPSDSLIKLIR